MRLVIGGLAGTGKSSLGKALAAHFHVPFLSAGSHVRTIAQERGVPQSVIEAEAERDRAIDDEIARRTYAFAQHNEEWVIEGWFAWHVIRDTAGTFRVKLTCEDRVRLARIAVRDTIPFSRAREETIGREATLIRRFAERSGVSDWDSDRHCQYVVDTTCLAPRAVFMAVCGAASAHFATS